jgi:ABC-type phosphate transport system permease subunit
MTEDEKDAQFAAGWPVIVVGFFAMLVLAAWLTPIIVRGM